METNKKTKQEKQHTSDELKLTDISVITYNHFNGIQFKHSHNFFELGYVRSGTISHQFEDKTEYLKKGDYFIIDIGKCHSYKKIETKEELIVQNVMFVPSFIDPTLKNDKNFMEMISVYPFEIDKSVIQYDPTALVYHDETGEIGMLLDMLEKESKSNTCHPHMLRSLLMVVLLKSIRKISEYDSSNHNDLINKILKYASEHYLEKDSLTTFASENYYSLPYLSGLFKDKMGVSYRKYIQTLRINEACRLLKSSSYTINQICQIVGYKSETQFYNVFFKEIGMTPKKYRELR